MRKKQIAVILAGVLAVCSLAALTGCGTSESASSGENSESESSIIEESGEEESSVAAAGESDADVEWISNRKVQYEEDEESWTVLFELKNASEVNIGADGTASISIIDENGNSLYQQDISFTKSQFQNWTSSGEETYKIGLSIPKADLSESETEDGTLTLTVEGDTYGFDPYEMSISDLPVRESNISITNSLPEEFKTTYSTGEEKCAVQITDVRCEYEMSYDNQIEITLYFTGEKTYDADGNNRSDSVGIGIKIYDSDGYVVGDQTYYTPDLCVGDQFRDNECSLWLSKLPIGDYTIELMGMSY